MGRREELVVYGRRAARAAFHHRPDAIRRVLYHRSMRREIGPLLKEMAAQRRPYREVDAEELEKVARSVHHEGIVIVTEPLPVLYFEDLRPSPEAVLLALDEVGNPHNLGAILRSAAWFGAEGIIVPEKDGQASLSPAAVRTAQGGAEVVPVYSAVDLPEALDGLRAEGVAVLGACQRASNRLFDQRLPRPLCIVLGNETRGLDPAVEDRCDLRVRIPGTDAVESLNVSVAAGILLAAALA